LITAKMRRTGHSSYSITRDIGAPEVADSGGPPAVGRWAGGASPPLRKSITNCISKFMQCEDWMLTGPTYKRVSFNRPRSTNKTVADDLISQICQ